ncbi:MAG: glutaminyl-peptide cyclotransferase [Rikenellaceae bacterium]
MKRCVVILLMSCLAGIFTLSAQPVTHYSYIVRASYPHATDSYTQGLEFAEGQLYESTGEYGKSRLLKVDLRSGATEQLAQLPKNHFGEGLTIVGDTIYQLTWRENHLHLYDRKSGKLIGSKRYNGEGWGLCSDGERIYLSDGSNYITVRDPKSFEVLDRQPVVVNDRAAEYLNELEWIDGRIWANIYTTDMIVIINPTNWSVEGIIDLTGLLPNRLRTPQTDVLNGIARNPKDGRIYVTGKNWSKLYEIEITPTL